MYKRLADGSDGIVMVADRSVDDESRFTEICVILTVGCALSTTAVALRSYTRLVLLRNFGWDDGVMVAAQVLAIATTVAIGLESKWGLGSHTWVQPAEYFIPYMKAFYSSIIVYNLSMCLVKISILLQYRRIFSVPMMQFISFYGVGFLAAWSTTLFFLLTLVCIPVAKFWDHAMPGRCLDSLAIWYVIASFNLASDFAIFFLPLPVVRSLQLPRRQKIMLFGVFGLGFFTCIISIIRLRTLKIAATTGDPNWDNVDAATWSYLEVTIAILAACLPTLRPMFSKIMPRLFSSSIRRSQGRSQYRAYIHAPGSCLNTKPNGSKVRTTTTVRSDSIRSLRVEDNIELAMHDSERAPVPGSYSVSVIGGGTQGFRKEDEQPMVGKGGIQATTVVTQQVTFESEQNRGPWTRCERCDSGSNV